MKIIVKGLGEKAFTPELIEVNLNFNKVMQDYETTLDSGIQSVKDYLDCMLTLGFSKDNFISKRFSVRENDVYNEQKRQYEQDGYVFSQNVIVTFDFDMEKLSELLEKTAQLKNTPAYSINFKLKDNEARKNEVLELAYKNALAKAKTMANVSGYTNKFDCDEINIESYSEPMFYEYACENTKTRSCSRNLRENLNQVISPDDVEIKMEIICKFIAE